MAANFSSKNFLGSLEAPWSVKNDSTSSSVGVSEKNSMESATSRDFHVREASFLGESIEVQGEKSHSEKAHGDQRLHYERIGSGQKDRGLRSEKYSSLKEGCSIRGAFECPGDLVLEGFIEGDIVVHGELTILETGVVRANIRASSVNIFGRVVGDIICSERIELQASSQVRGNLKTRRLVIQDGVIFDGKCEMIREERKSDDLEDVLGISS